MSNHPQRIVRKLSNYCKIPKEDGTSWGDHVKQERIVGYLDGLAGQVAALARPEIIGVNLQSETAAELDALLPSILDRAFKGEL